MTFKHLANELMEQGWRCYHIEDMPYLTRGDNIHSLAVRNLLEIQVYEGKSLVFVRDSYPKDKPKSKRTPPKYGAL